MMAWGGGWLQGCRTGILPVGDSVILGLNLPKGPSTDQKGLPWPISCCEILWGWAETEGLQCLHLLWPISAAVLGLREPKAVHSTALMYGFLKVCSSVPHFILLLYQQSINYVTFIMLPFLSIPIFCPLQPPLPFPPSLPLPPTSAPVLPFHPSQMMTS